MHVVAGVARARTQGHAITVLLNDVTVALDRRLLALLPDSEVRHRAQPAGAGKVSIDVHVRFVFGARVVAGARGRRSPGADTGQSSVREHR